jgi:hypothetical protein
MGGSLFLNFLGLLLIWLIAKCQLLNAGGEAAQTHFFPQA